jgi:alanyl-tRNA synthetase
MEFFKDKEGKYTKLKQHNVDTGLGLERMAMLLQGKETPFETELFAPIMDKLAELQKVDNIASRRIVTEHLRSSMMIINDGGRPSNVDRGYILRRLIRRMIRHMNKLQISLDELGALIDINVENLKELYPALEANRETIKTVLLEEKDKYVTYTPQALIEVCKNCPYPKPICGEKGCDKYRAVRQMLINSNVINSRGRRRKGYT